MRSPQVPRRRRSRLRKDIEGLRAVAVGAVVLYHAHVPFVTGGYVGVDVFFVISGFLITDHLWTELDGGRLALAAFYGRRMRRLLPASMLVLVVTIVASVRWLPPLQSQSVWKDGVACALYLGNYRFVLAQTNYLVATAAPSPFQHYWSLGVEEQFYLLWPVLLLFASRIRRRGRPSRPSSAAAIGMVAAGSFTASLILTRSNQPWAFFSLPTRAWELAVGGAVALAVPWLRSLPAKVAAAVGWAGLAAVVWSALTLRATTPFPGWAAVVPVGGAAAIIVAGLVRSASGPVLLLGGPGMRFVGRISYPLYLWHWPVLILAPFVVGHSLNEAGYLGLVALSVVLATITALVVERPVQHWQWLGVRARRSLTVGGSLTVFGVVACVVAAAGLPSTAGHGTARIASRPGSGAGGDGASGVTGPGGDGDAVSIRLAAAQTQIRGAIARSALATTVPGNIDPTLLDAASSLPAPDLDGCLLSYTATVSPPCSFGDPTGSRSIVLFGDSHATMWFPAIDSFARAERSKLYVWTKATCPPVQIQMYSPPLGREFSECDRWRAATLARIEALRPSLVVFGIAPNYNSDYHVAQDGPQWLEGLAAVTEAIRRSGAHVAVLGPVPSPPGVVPDCLSANLTTTRSCNIAPVDSHLGPGLVGYDNDGLARERAEVTRTGAAFLDAKPWFCSRTTCPVIVDNLLVFRDGSHVTVPFATYLAPVLADELDADHDS